MSLRRLVYFSAVIGGWAALLAWLACEALFLRSQRLGGQTSTVLAGGLVGAALAGGLNLVTGMNNARWKWQLWRLLPAFAVGGASGAVGALIGMLTYGLGLPRAIGWAIMGLGIGVSQGVCERSWRKLRNGVIGGTLGGLAGGLLFEPIHALAPAGLNSFSRATAFVILGISTGTLAGFAQVALKEAWLTVLDGFRPGRQLILGEAVTVLGRGDHLSLPFLGYPGKDLESEHLRIVRRPDGVYQVEDNHSRLGTRLNGLLLDGPATLNDGDLIKLGTNIVRFNHRQQGRDCTALREGGQTASLAIPTPPLPPPPISAYGGPGPGFQLAMPWMTPKPPEPPTQGTTSPKIPPPPPPPGVRP